MFKFCVRLDELIEQRLHVRLVRCRLKGAWLALDRQRCYRQRLFYKMQVSICKVDQGALPHNLPNDDAEKGDRDPSLQIA
jgi:hypothetical protein